MERLTEVLERTDWQTAVRPSLLSMHEHERGAARIFSTPPAPSHLLRVTVLGAARVSTAAGVISPTKPIVHAAALYFGVSRGRMTRRGELARLLWPDDDEARHGERIRWLVHQLKRAGLAFEARNPELGLRIAEVALDIDLLDAPDARSDVLGIPPGDVLAGYDPQISDSFARWVDSSRDLFRARVLHVFERWLAEARAAAHWRGTEDLARRILLLDEYHEGASIALAESLALQGRRCAAVEVLGRHQEAQFGGAPVPASALLRERLREHRVAARESSTAKVGVSSLVGRSDHLARILDSSADSGARRIGVAGPSGMGKTRLLDEVAGICALRGVQVLHVRCAREDPLRPLSLVADLATALREARGALGASPEALERLAVFVSDVAAAARRTEQESRAIDSSVTTGVFGALVELLNAIADEGPLTIIVDDAHRAEASSWSILGPLFPRASTNPITWIIALSAESQQVAAHRFRTIYPLDEATCDKSREIHWLSPLPDADIRELCVTRATPREIPERALTQMVKHAVGVPFFAEALLEQWFSTGDVARVPLAIARVTQARLDRHSSVAELVVASIAVLGRDATPPAVEAVSMLSRRALITSTRTLEDAGVVSINDGLLCAADHWCQAVAKRIPDTTRQLLQHAGDEWRSVHAPARSRSDSAMPVIPIHHGVAAARSIDFELGFRRSTGL
jgi:DNA-binding SARP family transcriptional activator